MRALSPVRFRSSPLLAAVLLFGVSLLFSGKLFAEAPGQLPPTQHMGGVEYVSGGIGLDESTAFKEAMSQYPLAMTFASQGNGVAAYVSDVQVVIRDANDGNVLNVTSEGPYFLARLAPGQYQIFATYDNETQSRKVAINATGTTRVGFNWSRPKSGPD
jgi:hypothetical protein